MLESSISHIVILMILSLSIIKDLMNSSLISTPKKSPFLRLQNLLQLLLISGDNKYTASDICKMIEFLVDNIYVRFGGQLFRQTVSIPMETNCAQLLADLFLYSYENELLHKLSKEDKRNLLETSVSHIVILMTYLFQ